MCQVVGTRSDVFPPQYVKTLSQCHDRLPPRDLATVRRVVEEDFGRPLEAVFEWFAEQPVAAAHWRRCTVRG
jgi:predicted unusual protein kinase regulating ubiquinone biosynthesis (AarF/ABC1/UbiB family)